MTYEVLALKYRPKVFEDLVGQETVTRTLTHAIQQNRIAHAFLFAGVRGVGKTTTARILAKALNCASGPTVRPCGECAACLEIARGSSLDVLEIDGASNNGVAEVRDIIEASRYAPSRDRFKIYIIDEVHMLSTPAFNALLKTLEEPPPSVKFIFATTEYHKIPDTILSRCQEFEFRTVS
ncbi:MAG TPA: DNA polymerase III subunit gamma/tau, partial [Vicinamibacteria bacterium]|nr:DNA polymerase III subunit gamma/tau [Vicinamibacteria bacterium]